jgi:hypothetical protein
MLRGVQENKEFEEFKGEARRQNPGVRRRWVGRAGDS